jgi:outer membrane biosynthesis protein TonB
MNTNSVETNKNKLIASTVSVILFGSLLVFLVFYSILTPNTDAVMQSGGIEIGFNGADPISGITQNLSSQNNETKSSNEKNEFKSNSPIIIPSNDKTSAELVRDQFFENKGKTSAGNENQSGEKAGDPNGNTTTNATRLLNTEVTTAKNIAVTLPGRKIEAQPTLSKDTKEEGKVVVEITVDKLGNVIKADPNGRGTTTSSSVLKEKAKQTALSTKFSISSIEEQKGTITLIFSF